MNPFFNEAVAEAASDSNGRHFPLDRGGILRDRFSHLLSRHVGKLRSETWFEAEILVVTGLSGSGKTREITTMLTEFHKHPLPLQSGENARVVQCLLDRKGGWKDLGRTTLKAMGYDLSDKARLTQSEIWRRVALQAKAQGIICIHYDEAQHIFAGKSDNERETILDSFKTLLKLPDWPLMLIMSGVPELSVHVRSLDQLYSKVTSLHFEDIELPNDLSVIHEVVGSYALESGIGVDEGLLTADFYQRLTVAAAFRWGSLIKMTSEISSEAAKAGSNILTLEHFVEHWIEKTGMNEAATPFTHDLYETVFPCDRPFQARVM